MEIYVDIRTPLKKVKEWGYSTASAVPFSGEVYDLGENGWFDPSGTVLMLRPLQLNASCYPTTPAGAIHPDLARMRLSAWDQLDGVAWEECCPRGVGGDYFFVSHAIGGHLRLKSANLFPDNAGIWVAVQVVGPHAGNYIVLEHLIGRQAGFDGVDYYPSTKVLRYRLYSSGWWTLDQVEWPSGGAEGASVQLDAGFITEGKTDLAGRMVQLLILPYRRRCVLFYTDGGGGGHRVWESPDLPDTVDDETVKILYGEQQHLKFPETKGIVQVMQVRYPQLGVMTKIAQLRDPGISLPYAPDSDSWGALDLQVLTEKDHPTANTDTDIEVKPCKADGTVLAKGDWDGTITDLFWRINAKSVSGGFSPALYKAVLAFPTSLEPVVQIGGNLTPFVLAESLKLEMTADPSQRAAEFVITDVDQLTDGLGNPLDPTAWHNRQVSVWVGPDGGTRHEIFRGYVNILGDEVSSGVRRVRVSCVDPYKRLRNTPLLHNRAYDNEIAIDAVRDLLEKAGLFTRDDDGNLALITADIHFLTDSTRLWKSQRHEEDLYRPTSGQPAADFLDHILETHFNYDWVSGFRPVMDAGEGRLRVKYCFYPRPTTPLQDGLGNPLTLCFSKAEADSLGSNFWAQKEWQAEYAEVGANEWWVVGMDADGNLLISWDCNELSQNPDLAAAIAGGLSERLWLGERRICVVVNASLNSQEACDTACALLGAQVFREVATARVTAEMFPYQGGTQFYPCPGDLIQVGLAGGANDKGLWRYLGYVGMLSYVRPSGGLPSITTAQIDLEKV